MQIEEIRAQIHYFAIEMEKILRENDHKGGWDDCEYDYLRNKMGVELTELDNAENDVEAMHEVIDIANYCMMIWSNIKDRFEKVSYINNKKGD